LNYFGIQPAINTPFDKFNLTVLQFSFSASLLYFSQYVDYFEIIDTNLSGNWKSRTLI